MGEVYEARDPRLDRTVAIKVLSQQLSGLKRELDSSVKRRPSRAESSSYLRRSRRRPIGVTDFLVMELLEGETLARRLERGPLPLDQALKYAMEMVDALDKAQRRGMTHRDLW